MAQIINTNMSSLNAQRYLNGTNSALSSAMERLASGKRINSAKDDAAGLGISARMTSQINGMNQAIRNANDGISLSQTAEGALSKSEEMLQRIRTLAVQSSNASNSPADRQAMQSEVNQLTAELDRFAQTTSFNGKMLLDGTMGSQNFQVGAEAGELISFSGMNFRTNMYGNYNVGVPTAGPTLVPTAAAAFTDALTNGVSAATITMNGALGKDTYVTTANQTAAEIAAGINSKTEFTGVSASASTTANLITGTADKVAAFKIYSDNGKKSTDAVTVTATIGASATTKEGNAELISAINKESGKTGVTAEWDSNASVIKLSNISGNDIKVQGTTANETALTLGLYTNPATGNPAVTGVQAIAAGDETAVVIAGQIEFNSDNSFVVADGGTGMALTGASTLQKVSELDVSTFEGAQRAIKIASAAINSVNKEMANYGALQNRLQYTIENLEISSENTTNARSRIQDADYAQETANLSRASILQQAGTAMLAQANQMPQNVLSLIG
ncbi:flagellin [Oxalobacter vibrioformis]|uniref:Flagellin n=1 Tax=Oxalobacter vibrioformis TaxID=933080 RepID=A0A9E9LYG3_9BURK|nr:flagellin [Oxalobacter vibrioformis]WAW09543.1 flagellin [Oxalobacter vibrioformis]